MCQVLMTIEDGRIVKMEPLIRTGERGEEIIFEEAGIAERHELRIYL